MKSFLAVVAFLSCATLFVLADGRVPFHEFPGSFPAFPVIPSISSLCKTTSTTFGVCRSAKICPQGNADKGISKCESKNGDPYVCCPLSKVKLTTASEPLNMKQVSPPKMNFKCGQRGSIQISFGFGASPVRSFAQAAPVRGFAQATPIGPIGSLLARAKRDSRGELQPNINIDDEVAIVGGIPSFQNSWPWMVLLGRKSGPMTDYFCSGVLINKEHLLTAAHCVLSLEPFFARFGEHDHSISGGTSRPPENIVIKKVVVHPEYDDVKGYNDIAILKLSRPVAFRNEVKPVCLPWGSEINENLINKRVTVTGWGSVKFGGSFSRVLQEVKISVFEPSVCHNSYSSLPGFEKEFPDGITQDNSVCAGDLLGGKDTCQGDSGGPMVFERPNSTFTLAGIISQGYGCGKADFPGLYTPIRNTKILEWIKKNAF